MRQPPTNICPLHGNACFNDDCALRDYLANNCAIVSLAVGVTEIAAELRYRKGDADGRKESA